MKKISEGIVFSEDIERILNGVNAFDYQYDFIPNKSIISLLREDFKKDTNNIFNGKVSIIIEDEMLRVNDLIGGEYPHCISR